MNESLRTLDARGLACPEPVILARKALAEGGFDLLELLVDDASTLENVVRFAEYAHCGVETVDGGGGVSRVRIRPGAGELAADAAGPAAPDGAGAAAPGAADATPSAVPGPAAEAVPAGGESIATVFIAAAGIGTGDEALAALLMRGFLYTLTEAVATPRRIILMNAGVRLAVEGSESLVNLRRLAERGVEVLACGTCLESYQLKGALAVGRVSNMYEIAGLLLEGRVLRI